MSYKPDESQWIAYLYGELEGEEKQRVERYLEEHPDALQEMQAFNDVRETMGKLTDKEVIAPPIVMQENRAPLFWNTSYGRTLLSLAASIALILMVGYWTGFQVRVIDKTLILGFGATDQTPVETLPAASVLTANDVQYMINNALTQNNETLQTEWLDTRDKLNESVRATLAANSTATFDALTQKVATASEDQIRQFALLIQADNARMIKEYLTLNSSDQRKYIEELLVDFAKYLEQQHRNDLNVLQVRLNNIEQNTDLFKYETEQILTSIITSVEQTNTNEIKN